MSTYLSRMSDRKGKILALLMCAATTFSALAVVWATHEARELTNQLLSMRAQENSMMVSYGQYLLQERSLTSAAGLEVVAVDSLGLRFPSDADIEILLAPAQLGGR